VEIFVDFGLFELLAAAGLAALSKVIYSKKLFGLAILIASVVAPAALVILCKEGLTRWIALGALATALVNAAIVGAVLQSGEIPQLRLASRINRGKKFFAPLRKPN